MDPRDKATAASAGKALTDYTKSLRADALKGARIGVARKRYFGYHPDTDRLIEQAIADMKAQGAVIVDPADIPTAAQLDACEFEILLYEFKADLNAYLGALGPAAKVHSLKELIAFDEREKDREMPYFGQEIALQAEKKGPLTSPAYRKALTTCRARARTLGIDAVMTKYKLDALIAPTGGPAWPTDLINGDHFLGASSTPPAVAGYPSITVPAGFVHGLPVGMSFIGRAWSEARLIGSGLRLRAGHEAPQAAGVPAAGGHRRLDQDLDDRLAEVPASAKRRVRILREEDGEQARRDAHPDVGRVVEEPDVPLGRELAARPGALLEGAPSDLLVTGQRDLDVDVLAVRLEPRPFPPAPVLVIDRHVELVASDGVAARREGSKVRAPDELDCLREPRVHRGVPLEMGDRHDDHRDAWSVMPSFFFRSFFRCLSYHATMRCSKSMLSATLFGGRWAPLT